MKKISLLLLCAIFMLACNSESTPKAVKEPQKKEAAKVSLKLSPTAFQTKLNSLGKVQLVDVRTPEEYAEGHLENAVNYNFYDDDFKAKLATLDPNLPVMLYCKSGGRSGKTYNQLKGMNFKEVYDMAGGYSRWSEEILKK